MQVRQEIERDEVVLRLPNKVWQEDGDGCRHSEPQPAALQESASRRQHYRTGDPECEKSRGVARLHAESEHRPDPYPPARIVGLQQPHQKVGNGHSPQVIEGDVLHDRALDQRNRRDPGRHGGQQLNVPPAAQFFRDQPGQHHHSAHRGRGKDTKPYERGAEQNQFQSRDERRDRRIDDEAPIEVAGVVERLQLVAVKSISAVGRDVQSEPRSRDQHQNTGVRS